MTKSAVVTSQVFLVLLFVGAVAVQAAILPTAANQAREIYPEVGYLHAPFLVLSIAIIACGQVLIVCVWMLLRLVRRDRIFVERAFVWMAIMIGALIVATVLAGVMFLILNVILQLGGPPLVSYGLLVIVFGCITLALVLVAMRKRLRKATAHAAYLEGVVQWRSSSTQRGVG